MKVAEREEVDMKNGLRSEWKWKAENSPLAFVRAERTGSSGVRAEQ